MYLVDWFMTKLTQWGKGDFFSINDAGSTMHYSYGIKRNLYKGPLQNTVTYFQMDGRSMCEKETNKTLGKKVSSTRL